MDDSFKFQFNKVELQKFKLLASNIKCKIHTQFATQLLIKKTSINLIIEQFQFGCYKCLQQDNIFSQANKVHLQQINIQTQKSNICVNMNFLNQLIELGIQIFSPLNDNNQLERVKYQIKRQMCLKYIRKQKMSVFYEQLNQYNKQILDKQQKFYLLPNQLRQNIIKQAKTNYQSQFKGWIKDPIRFQQVFGFQINKTNLKYLWIKHSYIICLKLFKSFFKNYGINTLQTIYGINKLQTINFINKLQTVNGFNSQQKINGVNKQQTKFGYQNLIQNLYQKIQFMRNMIESVKQSILDFKKETLNRALNFIKTQSNIQTINISLTKFFKIYIRQQQILEYRQSKSSYCHKYRFRSIKSNKDEQNFNFNIELSTVSLIDPMLKLSPHYQNQTYDNEFKYLNDGLYLYNNQYRMNILCEQVLNSERNKNTLICHQFNDEMVNQQLDAIFIQIYPQIHQKQSVQLRLRLNTEQLDKIKLGICWSSNLQNLLSQIHDKSQQIILKIIPDLPQNNISHLLYKQFYQILRTNYKGYKYQLDFVMQDDVIAVMIQKISLNLYFIVKNITRDIIMKKVVFQPNTIIKFHSQIHPPLFVTLGLYKTIAQIQIYQQAKK